MSENELELAQKVIQHFNMLLSTDREPLIPKELTDNEGMRDTHAYVVALRKVLTSFARGDVLAPIERGGFTFGALKTLQANLQPLIEQVKRVSQNDYDKRKDLLGELSAAFNGMVNNISDLESRQETLARLTETLRQEVQARSDTLKALRESEARFRYQAEHDPLTDAMNRRSFLNTAESEMQKSAFAGSPCALAMLDVDYFKQFNDSFGHLAGDMALRQLVAVTRKNLRGTDFMGRYGGEEFTLFFSDADEHAAIIAAERIRNAIANNPATYEGRTLKVTVSIGVSIVRPEWPGKRNQEYLCGILDYADRALYQAKREGRNRFFVLPPSPPANGNSEPAD